MKLQSAFLSGAAVMYAAFTAYGAYLVANRPGVPCACSTDAHPVDVVVTARAFALTGLAVLAAAYTPVVSGMDTRELAITCVAACAYGLVVWNLPQALQDPLLSSQTASAGRQADVV